MRIQRVQPHPGFARLHELLRAHGEWFGTWSGTVFRFQTVDFPTTEDVLSGKGAFVRGGRWNPPGLATLYGSTTDTTALEECKANDRYYGIVTRSPRLLVAIEAQLDRVLDLTSPMVRRGMGVTLRELGAEDWRKSLNTGRECLTQAVGRAVVAAGGNGLLARSAAVRHGINLAPFPSNCPRDGLTVVEGEKLDLLSARRGA